MENILEINNLQKTFGKFVALKNVSFNVGKGRIVGLLGKNGAGKTTLIKTVLGLLKNYDGEILYDGLPINTSDPFIMNTIGSLVDSSFHEDLTAFDNLNLLAMVSPVKIFDDYKSGIMKLLELVDLKNSAKSKVKSFSFGMKQRLALAQALMVKPKLLMLDEPFVGLDPMGIELVKEKLLSLCRDEKVSIIFSSHQLAEVAEISDDIVILNSGKVGYCGTYSQLINDTKMYHVFLRRDAPPNFLQKLGVMTKDNRRELHFKHSESILDEVLREVCNIGLGIENITIADNSLLGLFSD